MARTSLPTARPKTVSTTLMSQMYPINKTQSQPKPTKSPTPNKDLPKPKKTTDKERTYKFK